MYAVFKSGGKQHRVQEGDTVRLEKLEVAEGEAVEFDEVLLVGEGESVSVGAPFVSGSLVSAEVVSHGRGDKVKILKFRRRKHHMKQAGHRQWYTDVKITGIAASGAKPAAKAEKTAPAPKAETAASAEKPATKAADLSALNGVGPAMVKKLDGVGITTLEQLANLSAEEQEKIGEELSIASKLGGWIEQAKQLAADEG